MQSRKPERSCFEWEGWTPVQLQLLQGYALHPAQSSHVPGNSALTCESLLPTRAYRCALNCGLHMQVPTFCRDVSSPCCPWFIPQLLLWLLVTLVFERFFPQNFYSDLDLTEGRGCAGGQWVKKC